MDANLIVAGLAVWTLACFALGWILRGHDNAAIARHIERHGGPENLERRARRVQ